MDFSDILAKASLEFRSKNPNLAAAIEDLDYLYDNLYSKESNDVYHDYIIRLIQSLRRNLILSGFLIESRQLNSWIQVMRTIIESAEILLATLVNFNWVRDVLKTWTSDLWSVLDKVRSIFITWQKSTKNLDTTIISSIKEVKGFKDMINSILTHANPYHNMFTGSWLIWNSDTIGYTQTFLDAERENSPQKDYALLLLISYSLLLLIYRVSQEGWANAYLRINEDVIIQRLDWKLELIVEVYNWI